MECNQLGICGGCLYRQDSDEVYRQRKLAAFGNLLNAINQTEIATGTPQFISDSTRRRANLSFTYKKGCLTLGFNASKSSTVLDLPCCPLLTPALNNILPVLRQLLLAVCGQPYQIKKGKKFISHVISAGDVWLTEAANGIDIVLEYDAPLGLEHRMIIFEQANASAAIVRVSHRCDNNALAEPVLEKAKPYINIGEFAVYIPAGTFLQPSAEGEQALTGLVLRYLGETTGKIADLFCGVGTFSYVLAANKANQITAVDSSPTLLAGFQESLNRNMIPNIKIITRNLFKYPLDQRELPSFEVIVFDPPRAGAAAQIEQVSSLPREKQPAKIIAVSCNPHTFVNDANHLINSGYHLDEVTLVDQFIYSNHSELVALFTKS